VLGHTRCGAVMGACDQTQLGNLTQLLQKIGPAVIKETTTKKNRNSKNSEFVQNVTILNVEHTIERIRVESPIISQLEKEGVIRIAGGIYDVETGQVKFLQTRSKQMPVPLAQYREA
jgi:carbonic anhydrase